MGGRRKTLRIQKKEKPLLVRTVFDCAVCGYKNCIIIKIKKMYKKALLNCARCERSWETNIRTMDEAVDVYQFWLQSLKGTRNQKNNNNEPSRYVENGDDEEDFENFVEQKPEKVQEDQTSEDSLVNKNDVKLKEEPQDEDESADSLDEKQFNSKQKKEASQSDSLNLTDEDEDNFEKQPIKKVKI